MRDIAIGYYAHHHGLGHITRARTIAAQLPCAMTLFSSVSPLANLPASITMRQLAADTQANAAPSGTGTLDVAHAVSRVPRDSLPDELPNAYESALRDALPDASPHASPHALPNAFHYAPLGMHGIAERMAVLVNWFRDAWPCLLVVDVSVEVALLARLCSVPTIYIRQQGSRSDPPHALAYASAASLIAPYPEHFADSRVLDEWKEKTTFTGFISRYRHPEENRHHDQVMPAVDSTIHSSQQMAIVLLGHGGTAFHADALCEAARSCPHWRWTVIGPISPPSNLEAPTNIAFLGVLPDPARWMAVADVVIGSAGDSVVAEMAAFRQRFICFAEPRPFDEQMATARSLERHALAVYCRHWPSATMWPVILERAMRLTPARWDRFNEADGAIKAATTIMRTARTNWPRFSSRRPSC